MLCRDDFEVEQRRLVVNVSVVLEGIEMRCELFGQLQVLSFGLGQFILILELIDRHPLGF